MERVTIRGDRPFGAGERAAGSEIRKFKAPPVMAFKDRPLREHEKD